MVNRQDKLKEAVEKVKSLIKNEPYVGMIFGSGLGELTQEFEGAIAIKFEDIPHFPVSHVAGHRGELVGGSLMGVNVLAMAGRSHYYEGVSMDNIGFAVRVLASSGVKKLIVTNAGGGVNKNYSPGDIIVIKDHINFMGDNPLRVKEPPEFIDMTDVYSLRLRNLAKEAAGRINIPLREGVYLAMSGPSYETPAEIKMAQIIGADIVGMSTVPEVIVARSCGLEILGLSLITNMAAGITGEELSHGEVIETSSRSQEKFKKLVKEVVGDIGRMDR